MAATAGKAGKLWSLPGFWVSIHSCEKQRVKINWGRILDLAWFKFAVAAMLSYYRQGLCYKFETMGAIHEENDFVYINHTVILPD